MKTFALFHPGEMGAALGAALASRRFRVLWASQVRSTQTGARAKAASLEDACTIEPAVKAAEVVISVCPPHAALELGAKLLRMVSAGSMLTLTPFRPPRPERLAQ
jgi:predicted dinucleotide-binding enzyme